MRIIRCSSVDCGRPFQLNEYQFSTDVSIPWARGEISCPHCGMRMTGNADSVFLAHALTASQEKEFNEREETGEQEELGQAPAGKPGQSDASPGLRR